MTNYIIQNTNMISIVVLGQTIVQTAVQAVVQAVVRAIVRAIVQMGCRLRVVGCTWCIVHRNLDSALWVVSWCIVRRAVGLS